MTFLYLVGALALFLLLLDRLVDVGWLLQVLGLGVTAVVLAAAGHLTFWAVPAAMYFAILLSTVQAGTAEFLRASQLSAAHSKTRRVRLP